MTEPLRPGESIKPGKFNELVARSNSRMQSAAGATIQGNEKNLPETDLAWK